MKKTNGKTKKNQTENQTSLRTKLLICLTVTIVIITIVYFGTVFLYRQIFSENKRFNVTKVIVSSNGYWNNRNNDLALFCSIKLNSDNIWNLSLNRSEVLSSNVYNKHSRTLERYKSLILYKDYLKFLFPPLY